MSKIFKNMLPYWKSILVILMLLFVQAWCDLSLPSYTSDIIDVGIQNSGVEHVTPKRITEEEFQTAEFIMTDDEVDLWESLYTKKDGYYERNKASEKELDETDDTLTVALLMNYQMGAMEEDTFKQLMAQQTGQDASVFENMQDFQRKVENNAFLTRERAEQEQQRLLNKQQELQNLDNQLAQELMQEQQKLNEQLRDTVVSQLKAFNLGRGYQVVFSNTVGDNILLAGDSYDITGELLEYLNKNYSSPAK